ncbi:hypothetical protein AMJ52_05565 [candidate division TA06 bacterium DG_78]|uniref:YhaN AAA domain-containing protein n=1 Tax=candidate division TA06 bacterium DG_78 TaxID=1703772 RepID=A0A0S7YD57_UNCT6|nr:MAG: hypothetical protein AMJ52_05565 [candidate division TA06 bacterium DG_78]
MKIKSVTIRDYGPIKDLTFTLDNFEVIFGLNESGKTAIVEALSYTLFKKISTGLRYGKPNNINIEIEENERIYNLPAKKMNLDLPSGDVANLLYVQASASAVYGKKGEASFWDGIKAMFSKVGSGVSFTKLDSKIFEKVGLTPKRSDWNEEKQRFIQNEERRRHELGNYLKEISETEKKEVELTNLLEKHASFKKELKEIENYKNFKNYQTLINLYNNYLEKMMVLQEYERYKNEYLTKWQELETNKKVQLDSEMKLQEVKVEIKELEKETAGLEEIDKIIETEQLKFSLDKIKGEVKEAPIVYPIISVAIIAMTLILLFLAKITSPVAFILFTLGILPTIYYIYKKKSAKTSITEKNEVLTKARKAFPDMTNISDLTYRIDSIQKTKIEKTTKLAEKRKFVNQLTSGDTTTNIEKQISELRNKTGLAELVDLKDKLEKKNKIENELNISSTKISTRLHEDDSQKWGRLINNLKTAKPEKEPDLSSEMEIKKELEKHQEKIDHLTSETKIFRELQQTKFNITDDRSVFIEYDQLEKKLKNYELEKKAALKARVILKEMSGELDEFIHDIIEGEESLSEYFKLITEHYDEVEIKDKNFVVKGKSGKKFKIENLSSGTQDQLLLCFRIAALKKIYPEGSFLILDDAFIFADWERRQRLVRVLKKFIDDGNQVLYLTSDDHTRDLFEETGAKVTTL